LAEKKREREEEKKPKIRRGERENRREGLSTSSRIFEFQVPPFDHGDTR